MIRSRMVVAGVSCMALVAGAVAGGSGAASAAQSSPSLTFALIADSGVPLRAATGRVTVLEVPSSAALKAVMVTPAQARLLPASAAAPAAKTVARKASIDVGSYRTTNSGQATLAVPYTSALAAAASANAGWVNFEIIVGKGADTRFVSFSRRWDGTRWVGRPDESVGAVLKVASAGSSGLVGTASVEGAAGQPRAVGAPHATCVWWGPISSTTSETTVGELHTGADTKGEFHYGRTADSDIEVGYKYGAKKWEVSGTAHVGTTKGAQIGWVNKGPEWRYPLKSKFTYGKYEYIHDSTCGPNRRVDYKTVALRWEGGATTGKKKTGTWCGTDRYTEQYAKGTVLIRNKSRAYKFTGSASAFGVSLSSTSGYSNNVDFKLSFGDYTDYHWVCGNNAFPVRSQLVWVM